MYTWTGSTNLLCHLCCTWWLQEELQQQQQSTTTTKVRCTGRAETKQKEKEEENEKEQENENWKTGIALEETDEQTQERDKPSTLSIPTE